MKDKEPVWSETDEMGFRVGDMNGEWQASKEFLKKLEKTAPKRKQPDKFGRRIATPVEIKRIIKKK